MSRADRWKSDSQANAEALANRGRTYADPNAASFRLNWDWHNREPRDLRECVRMVRAAYQDEVPARLHNRDIADDGTPKMTPQAEGYIFGSETAGETPRAKCDCGSAVPDSRFRTDHKFWCAFEQPALDFYRTPFRAALAHLERSNPPKARIVQHVTLGSLNPVEAAMRSGVPFWCAKLVAEDVLRAFLRNLSDVKVHLPREDAAA